MNTIAPLAAEKIDHKVIPVTTAQPEENKVYPCAIIGAGAAGTMAVKRAVLNNNTVLLFAGAKQERRRSRGNWVRTVDNIPGLERYERTVLQLRNEALTDLVHSPFSNNLFIIENSVMTIEREGDVFKLVDNEGKMYRARHVILATGMMDEQPHIQQSIRPILPYANRQAVAYCILCDGHRAIGKHTVVIGYSESAASGALLLAERYHPPSITLLTNGKDAEWTSTTFTKIKEKGIVMDTSPILEILEADPETKGLKGFKLENGKEVQAEMAYVLLGIRPNNALALQLGAEVDGTGLVVADKNGESSIPNLFIAGDLRSNSVKQIYTAWQHGVDAAQEINRRLRHTKLP